MPHIKFRCVYLMVVAGLRRTTSFLVVPSSFSMRNDQERGRSEEAWSGVSSRNFIFYLFQKIKRSEKSLHRPQKAEKYQNEFPTWKSQKSKIRFYSLMMKMMPEEWFGMFSFYSKHRLIWSILYGVYHIFMCLSELMTAWPFDKLATSFHFNRPFYR